MQELHTRAAASLFFPFLCLLWIPGASARLATPDDASYVFEDRSSQVDLHKDGSYEFSYSEEIRILKEGRKDEIGTRRIAYNSRTTTLDKLEAEVINGDQREKVDSHLIEDKPLSSPEEGFDQLNQVTIAYPDVRQDSRMVLRYRMNVKEVPFEGHFSDRYTFGAGFFQKAGSIVLRSELPLFYEVNDPAQILEVKQAMEGKIQVTVIKLKAPIYLDAVNEFKPFLSMNSQTWVVVSTHQDYASVAASVSEKYEKILGAELPAAYKKIVQKASALSDPVDRINTVTSTLAEEVRYNGDWRPVHGGHVPRDLAVIDATRFGDCKDFAASTAAMLRRLGFEAYVAFVERGRQPEPFPKLAYTGSFNHAIVWAKLGDRKFLVDATNLQSFAQGVFEDIAERDALIVDPKHPRLEHIGGGDPSLAVTAETRKVRFLPNGNAATDAQIKIQGRAAVDLTAASLRYSKDVLDHSFVTSFTRENNIVSFKIDEYALSSRIVKDLNFRFHVVERRSSHLTTAGALYAPPVQPLVTDLLSLETKDRISGYFLGLPWTVDKDYILENVRMVGNIPKACRIRSPWVDVERTISKEKTFVTLREKVHARQMLIGDEELRSAEFKRFQEELKKCFDLVGVVYRTGDAD